MSENVLITNNLCKKYKTQMVLDSVSMNIQKGDIYGLVGENGAGKTTLIRAISGLINFDSGEISLFANTQFKNELYRASIIIEKPYLYEDNTALENLYIYNNFLDLPKTRVDEVLEITGLEDCRSVKNIDHKKKVNNFALGMKLRLSIAIALLKIPEFLVLDEPYNGLDPSGIKSLNKLLINLSQTCGVTMLISNHILKELETYATKYGFMHKGKLVHECKACDLSQTLEKEYDEKVLNI
jgi:ABC-2 type transport system ATP-binding protein